METGRSKRNTNIRREEVITGKDDKACSQQKK